MPRGNPDGNPNISKYAPKGRKKGAKSKFTVEFKEVLMQVFNSAQVGGVEGMITWASKNDANRTEFYRFMTKLLPKDMNVDLNTTESGVLLVPSVTMKSWVSLVEEYKEMEKKNENIDKGTGD